MILAEFNEVIGSSGFSSLDAEEKAAFGTKFNKLKRFIYSL